MKITTECPFCGRVSGDGAVLSVVACPRCFSEFVGPDDAPPEIDFQMPIELEVCVG